MNASRLWFAVRQRLISAVMWSMRARNAVVGAINPKWRFYAEYFTDRYVRRMFFPDYDYRGCMVEVGCATPDLLSMSRHFRECGWRCIGIEPNPRFADLHRQAGYEVHQYAAADFDADDRDFTVVETGSDYASSSISAHSYSSLAVKPEYVDYQDNQLRHMQTSTLKVKVRRLDRILQEECPDVTKIDLVSVDVEGYELEVMRGFDPQRYGMPVVVLENLFHDPKYTEAMRAMGYELRGCVKHNYVYAAAAGGTGAAAGPQR